ncbi:S1 RNA-binding domain-containing protein [Patescibacteria group bacterium]|nr:S1 RNA-binding domain-containing protein [Patescibacteria group bacterium]
MIDASKTRTSELEKLLAEGDFLDVPKLGDLIKGKILSTKGREVRVDVNGLTTGVVRGRELFTEGAMYNDLQAGNEVEATVIALENENGEMELSFRYAGNKKSWDELKNIFMTGDSYDVKVLDANKGGLIVKAKHIQGFLPVSQLAPEHYPRVSGGDKQKILDKLKEFVDQTLIVKILDMNEQEEKLIFSEKAVWESEQKNVISQIHVGDVVEGTITALADFGAFVKFFPNPTDKETALEGLVHISEIAWQRIDHPSDLLKTGQTVKAQIIGIEGSKIFLSMKKLIDDPWIGVEKKYKVDDVVEGKILKINPFGLFVELDPDIHGLAHVSELSKEPVEDIMQLAKIGDVRKFRIVSIEPKDHRLGLSIRALEEATEKTPEDNAADEADTANAADATKQVKEAMKE